MSASNRRAKRARRKRLERIAEMERLQAESRARFDRLEMERQTFYVDEMQAICNGQLLAGRIDHSMPTRPGWYYWLFHRDGVFGPFASQAIAWRACKSR